MSKIFNIMSAEEYQKDGETKTSWNQVGKLVQHDKGMFIKLNILPNQTFQVFEPKPKEQAYKEKEISYPEESDINF